MMFDPEIDRLEDRRKSKLEEAYAHFPDDITRRQYERETLRIFVQAYVQRKIIRQVRLVENLVRDQVRLSESDTITDNH